MSERCEAQVEQLVELLKTHGPETELRPADEYQLMDVADAAGRELPAFLHAWLLRVGGGIEGVALFDMSFDFTRLVSANEGWGSEKRGFLLVAVGVGFQSYGCDYYYDLARPSSPAADDFEVVSFPRQSESPPPSHQRDRLHSYYRIALSLREHLTFAIFHQLRLKRRTHQRDAIADPLPSKDVNAWRQRLDQAVTKSGFRPVGGLDGDWRFYDREDASLELNLVLDSGHRLLGISGDDPLETERLTQRIIEHMGMRLVPKPKTPMEADRS
jgi:hypothetical protein